MKIQLLISLAVATFIALGYMHQSNTKPLFSLEEVNSINSFTLWAAKYGKKYIHDQEKSFRYNKYLENSKVVQEHNAKYQQGLETFDMELNQFADMNDAEFSERYLGLKKRDGVTKFCNGQIQHVENPPAEVDWLAKGAVGKVQDQGDCGSCWAFSAIGSLQGLCAIEKGKLLSLSQQQLVDCSTKKQYGNEGCDGGYMDSALWYVIDHGITDSKTYPYTAKKAGCSHKKQDKPVFEIKDCAEVPANKTASLVDAVIKQPVSISVQADQLVFRLYKSGVMSSNCGHKLNHGILLTGYGNLNGKDYWKCKNSWGADWGSKGYILLAKGADGPGQCGILMQNVVPLESKQ